MNDDTANIGNARITELSQHESDGRKSEEGQCIAVEVLKIFGEATATVEPGDCALNNPTFREDHKSFGLIRTFNNFCLEMGEDLRKIGLEERSLICAVSKQFLQKRE
jgi:hypothetical protein